MNNGKLYDFNPIENLWSIIKRRVEDIQSKSIDDLIDLSFQTWESILINENHELYDSPPNRQNALIQKECKLDIKSLK